MELPCIGKQCSVSDCKQLDFLPFVCTCKLVFCQEHFNKHIEECPERKVQEKNERVVSDSVVYVCSKPGCKERSIVPLICRECDRHYCVAHRHVTSCEEATDSERQAALEKVLAPRRQYEEAKAIVDSEVNMNLKTARQKDKNIEMANKVQLMRLKTKATGQRSIPSADRVYFLVHNSKVCPEGKPVFVSKDWTVGKSIDAIAAECKIPNNNNVAAASKLRMFRKLDNVIVTNDVSDKIARLIDNKCIANGECLNMEYINEF